MTGQARSRINPKLLKTEVGVRLRDLPFELIYLNSCESTNSECMQRETHGSVVVAEQQTAGRGRRGNKWHSPFSGNIYCSIGMNISIPGEYLGLVSLQVGVIIAEVLRDHGYQEIGLKWPNDILLQGKKLGGILIETRSSASNGFFIVIGFGLNTDLDNDTLSDIDQPVICLRQVPDIKICRQQLLVELISEIYLSIMNLDYQAPVGLLERFSHFDSFQGRQVLVTTHNETVAGLYQGIQPTGQLSIKTAQGLQHYSAAEISLRES